MQLPHRLVLYSNRYLYFVLFELHFVYSLLYHRDVPDKQNPLLAAAEAELKTLLDQMADIHAEQQRLSQQEVNITDRIAAVSRSIDTLALVYGNTEVPTRVAALLREKFAADSSSSSLTESVRKVLESRYPNWLPPMVVRHYVETRGTEIKGDNPMAMIHQVLRRLVEQDWAEPDQLADGSKVYRQKRIGAITARHGKVESTPSLTISTVGFPSPRGRLKAPGEK